MPCYHPLKGFIIGKTENGKDKLKVVPGRVDHLELHNGHWFFVDTSDRSPYAERAYYNSVLLPCGKCIGCRLEYSTRWADRLMLERKYHDTACFITLTYDPKEEERLWRSGVDSETGEFLESLTLIKKDFQDFMKRLRDHFDPQKIRFYACGEYGPSGSHRPHFHAILFGVDFESDKYSLSQRGPCGDVYYSSPTLEKLWKHGFVTIGECSYESCSYVSRYVAKKLDGPLEQYYKDRNIEKPFCLMSRKPGIAAQYYEDHKDDLLDLKDIVIFTDKGAKHIRIPKYYDSKFEFDFPDDFAIMKERRKDQAIDSMQSKLARTDLDMFEYLENEERKRKKLVQSLKRSI